MMPAAVGALLPSMITIEAGPFRMGTPDSERSTLAKRYGGTRESYAEESPQHAVEVAQFRIARTPVTNALYAAFQQATGAHMPLEWRGRMPPQLAQHPVVDVSWHDAQALCAWLRDQTGIATRLPTEAEWEKAARGADGRPFPWGDAFNPSICNVKESGWNQTTSVEQFPEGASPYGLLDAAGNVWEWTQSLQAPYPYRDNDGRNEQEQPTASRAGGWLQRVQHRLGTARHKHSPPPMEQRRILRGGCYANPEGFARCACRLRLLPERRTPFVGVRLAADD